jgi:hypothetical protein
MKKLTMIFAMIVIAMNVFAENPVAPNCVQEKYPDLYTGEGEYNYSTSPTGEKITYVYMTIPFKNVKETKAGYYFDITHPIFGNECVETTSYIPDSDMSSLTKTFNVLAATTSQDELIKKMEIGIKLKFINGKATSEWRISSISYPKDFPEMKF